MEDVFKAMGDILNPNNQVETDKTDIRDNAFKDLINAINDIKDSDIKINLLFKLSKYITTL